MRAAQRDGFRYLQRGVNVSADPGLEPGEGSCTKSTGHRKSTMTGKQRNQPSATVIVFVYIKKKPPFTRNQPYKETAFREGDSELVYIKKKPPRFTGSPDVPWTFGWLK